MEPLMVNPLNKGRNRNNLSVKDACQGPKCLLIHFQPLKRGQPLSTKDKMTVPMCSLFGGSTVHS